MPSDVSKKSPERVEIRSGLAIMLTQPGLSNSKAARFEALNELINGSPITDEYGNWTGERGSPIFTTPEEKQAAIDALLAEDIE